uniref:hypothetical protein n=1 Tax=Kitasatospora sp. MBT63 TaxID=1444768 RepID=UPI00053BBA39
LAAREADAVRQLRAAAAEVLAAGIGGAGGVLQAEVLRVAHQARLLGLHRPAALAVALVTRLRAARARQAEHRLGDLAAVLRDLLEVTTALLGPAPAAGLRGTARQTYREGGGLRLYGLFAEPVLTATHAGVVAWAVDPAGRLSTVSDVTPHSGADAAAEAALTAGSRPVRLGDASLSHREFSRAGLVVQSATRTESGRLGAGAKVRAVRAAGADWQEQPSAALWSEPVASQADRALAAGRLPEEDRPAGADLLFLDVTVVGAGPVPGEVLAECAGLTLALAPAAAHPALPCRDNQALLASVPGLRLRVIGRLERAAHPRLRLLAAGQVPGPAGLRLPDARAGRVGLGLERLQQADLPSVPELSAPELVEPAPRPSAGAVPEPPVEVLGRRLEQAVTAGRRALAPGPAVPEAARLRAAGLGTAADLLTALCAAAADRERDVFGRLREGDPLAFALAWLAASCYREELATALCADAWRTG